jgi:hypothetical protein
MTGEHRPPQDLDRSTTPGRWAAECSVVCLLWGLLAIWSLLRVPVPGVNEPHYLCKAKHFWNPLWCAGDLFLESANPHLAFYAVFGWLTGFLSLEATAVVTRCVGLLVVAIGWQRMTRTLLGGRWLGLMALPVFLLLQSLGNWSGEWLVGGAESKVIAYGFLFWAIGAWLTGRVVETGLTAGLAVAFHPVVGGWGVVAAGLASLPGLLRGRFRSLPWTDSSLRIPPLFTGLLLLLLVSLPGVIPAVTSVSSGDPRMDLAATHLQVAHRLSHHLDPMQFPLTAHRYFGLLIVIWLLLQRGVMPPRSGREEETADRSPRPARAEWWAWFVLAGLLIALIGVLIAWGPRPVKTMPGYEWRIALLKFYPFRLADLMVPVAVSLACVHRFHGRWRTAAARNRTRTLVQGIGLVVIGFIVSLSVPGPDRNPSRLSPSQQRDWIAACTWIREQTPESAVVYSFDQDWAVKWYGHRPEYANYKDCPQDAPSLIEWNRRLWTMARWQGEALQDGSVGDDDLQELHAGTGITHLISRRFGPFVSAPAYENRTFRIYSIARVSHEGE